MELRYFKVGDKVKYAPGHGPRDLHSEVLFVGKQQVLLRNNRGEEFVREVEATGFEYWQPEPTIESLKELGDDLVNAIQDAAWTKHYDSGKPNLLAPTPHMERAARNWKEATR